MNRLKGFLPSSTVGTRCTSSENGTASGTSDYSTCSDNPGHLYMRNENAQITQQSVILAGHTLPNQESIDESDYSVNFLEKNIDVLTEDEDCFEDCKEPSQSESNGGDQSSEYIPLQSVSNLLEMKSNNHFYKSYLNANNLSSNAETSHSTDSVPVTNSQTEAERLITIMEETEVTYTTNTILVKNKSPINYNNTGELVVDMVEQLKNYEKHNKTDGNSTKRVLFANEENIINDNQENSRADKSIFKKCRRASNSLVDKNVCSAGKGKDINENSKSHNHNTTESFVLWEKYLESSEKISSRRSLSFSELNCVNESYGGDDEYSTTFKSLDETCLSTCSFDSVHEKKNSQQKRFSRRSKSCDDLLKEVKHLPHIIYQRFLKCLSKEIDSMLKQNVVCTCERSFKKRSNKENNGKNTKAAVCRATDFKKYNSTKESRLTPDRIVTKSPLKPLASESRLTSDRLVIKSPLKSVTNESRLTPERLLSNASKNPLRMSPKSPIKTPTKKRELYCWQKEIVSPVGEYIRGKRQSPFQSSPNKKKV
ncbi:uncharacterized protein LOC100678302 [Nasonia vitripennis]|uniref:Uncharacterized protein n=1 Tax=Nasonia vitripennis TaxID=7425 RepID=A0A7M7IPF0_NASVI|nr:uncharacterized protein LOC100678302 [Nasonia vitripennis]